MSADAWKIYDSFLIAMADGTCDLDNDTFKCALFTSSHTPLQSDDSYSSLSNEVAAGNGYSTGGAALTNVTWVDNSGTSTFDCDDITAVTASGGSVAARYAIIYDDTDTGKQLVAMCLLDNTPADVTIEDGNDLLIQINASGLFSISTNWS